MLREDKADKLIELIAYCFYGHKPSIAVPVKSIFIRNSRYAIN